MSIGYRIKQKRNEKRLTQSQLGALVNVSSQVISNWERGYTHPNHEDVARLAEALDCSTEYLHGRIDQPYPEPLLTITGRKERPPYKHIGILISTMVRSRKIKSRMIMDLLKIDNEQLNQLYEGDIAPTKRQAELLANLLETNKERFLPDEPLEDETTVAGQKISLDSDELKVVEELKKYPILFNDLASNPESKVKELIKLYKVKKMLDEDEEEYGEGFGELED
ncbi:hypothetical protein CHH80_11055 [Bacillus sp. 7504-2]|nr:hypothetical protein CHH80_11055 [Bacillus sp. 7504-2]